MAPNRLEVSLDGVPWTGALVTDSHGGYWLSINPLPAESTSLVVRVTVATSPPPAKYDPVGGHDWLAPSQLIDSADPAITATAHSIGSHDGSAEDKAAKIHDYISRALTWHNYPSHRADPASTTLSLGYGTCSGFARLFVALSRASDLPARTVQGAIFDGTDEDAHHQWAEYRDAAGLWHMVDPTTTPGLDLGSRIYLDLVYAPEENPLWKDSQIPIVYDATPHDGRLGYHLTNSAYTAENTYTLNPADR